MRKAKRRKKKKSGRPQSEMKEAGDSCRLCDLEKKQKARVKPLSAPLVPAPLSSALHLLKRRPARSLKAPVSSWQKVQQICALTKEANAEKRRDTERNHLQYFPINKESLVCYFPFANSWWQSRDLFFLILWIWKISVSGVFGKKGSKQPPSRNEHLNLCRVFSINRNANENVRFPELAWSLRPHFWKWCHNTSPLGLGEEMSHEHKNMFAEGFLIHSHEKSRTKKTNIHIHMYSS